MEKIDFIINEEKPVENYGYGKYPQVKIKKQQSQYSDDEDSEEDDDLLSPKDEYLSPKNKKSIISFKRKGLNKITNDPPQKKI